MEAGGGFAGGESIFLGGWGVGLVVFVGLGVFCCVCVGGGEGCVGRLDAVVYHVSVCIFLI